MAGASKVTSEFMKNAVVLAPTAKHTATVKKANARFRNECCDGSLHLVFLLARTR